MTLMLRMLNGVNRVSLGNRGLLPAAVGSFALFSRLPTIPPNYSFNIPESVHPYLNAVDSIHKDTWLKRVETTNCQETDYNREMVQHYIECFWTYNTNALDGSPLSLEETMQHIALGEGLSSSARDRIGGALNHDEAVKFLNQEVQRGALLSPALIKELHFDIWRDTQSVYGGLYRTEEKVETLANGESRAYSAPSDIPGQMQELCDWVNAHTSCATTHNQGPSDNTTSTTESTDNNNTTQTIVTTTTSTTTTTTSTTSNSITYVHPIVVATIAHYNFLRIQPFQSGNGRCSRLVLNFILTKHSYLPAVIRYRRKDDYLRALESANSGDIVPLVVFITEEMNYSDYIYQFFTTDRRNV